MKGSTTSIQKRRKSSRLRNLEDHISDLPEGVLCHILSLLPIGDAVKTCVLSKNWKSKWKAICSVNIHGNPGVEFVHNILLHLQNIITFHLRFSCDDEDEIEREHLTEHIPAILRHNIEDLELRMHYVRNMSRIHELPVLPGNLLKCSLLKNLVVDMPCTFKVSDVNCFPKLTSLYLKGVWITNRNFDTDTIIFTCPALKEFTLEHCEWLETKYVEINAPSLIRFKSRTGFLSDGSKDINYSIKINGAKLAKFVTLGCYPEDISLADSVVDHAVLAYILLDDSRPVDEFVSQSRKLFRQLPNVKNLSLWSSDVLKVTTEMKQRYPLPRFLELESLRVHSFLDVEGLLELLHAAPYLKSLELRMGTCKNYKYESVKPDLVTHIERLVLRFTERDGKKPNLDLAKYFLKNGVSLKNVYVSGCLDFPTDKVIEQLLMFPKGSTLLTIESTIKVGQV